MESSDKPASGEESPTTARPIDFDDEPQETGVVHNVISSAASAPSAASAQSPAPFQEQEQPPPKPPRPLSPQQQAEATLIEAFPTIESKVVKAVLVASGGQVEPAFNALLGMSDPDAQIEPTAPAQPPRPSRQVQQDELYARQLADHYRSSAPGRGFVSGPEQLPRQQSGLQSPNAALDRDHSFLDDDLPVIRENVRQGFLQTQTKVNKWISDFRKRIDGDEDDEDALPPGARTSPYTSGQMAHQQDDLYSGPSPSEARSNSRRSVDHDRYDSDPRVLSDNFTELEMRDEEDIPPKKPNRPLANPDLFKPTPPPPPQSGPVDEIDAMNRQPTSSATKSKKWQPLTAVAPNPESEDNDPFSLGDSDDEARNTDLRSADTDRLKKAASESTPEPSHVTNSGLEAQERSGSMATRNKDADKLLSETS